MITVDTKLRVFQNKIPNNILFANKMLFKFRKVESSLCSFCKAEDETYIHLFYRCRETSISTLDLPSISPQSAIFGFLDDALEHKLLINHVLLIFKNYLYKARKNKDLNFNILKNHLTKIRELEANLKASDKYSKKWAVISNIL